MSGRLAGLARRQSLTEFNSKQTFGLCWLCATGTGSGSLLEGGAGAHEAADPIQGHHEEVHDQQGGLGSQARQQADGPCTVHPSQLQVLKASLPHLLMRWHSAVAEHLQI